VKQVLHIFRKDVRHLWLNIVVVVLLSIAHAVFDVLSWPVDLPGIVRANEIAYLLNILLPLGLWFLIAQLVFQEALPGDRQFWLTRPYRWTSLLASKILFVIVFAAVPLFVSDCYILAAQGFAVWGVFPTLLLRQLAVAALFLLPSLTLATLTTGLAQFVLAWFILLLVFILEMVLEFRSSSFDVGSGVVFVSSFAAIFAGVAIWQYAQRRTMAARVALLAIASTLLPATKAVSYLPSLRPAAPALPASPRGFDIRVAYHTDQHIPSSQSWQEPPKGFALARIPLSVAGLPPNTLLRGRASTSIELRGRTWLKPGEKWAGSVEHSGGQYWQTIYLPKSGLTVFAQQPAGLRASIDFEVVNDRVETIVALTKPTFRVPNVGLCRLFQNTILTCRTGLAHSVETSIRYSPEPQEGGMISAPESSMPWGLSPTTHTITTGFDPNNVPTELAFIPRRRLTQFRRTLDVANIQLTRYVLPYDRSSQ
jgi:hypothetical protein